MKLKELVEKCRTKDYVSVIIRDKTNNTLCVVNANSKFIFEFYNYEVLEWFPSYDIPPFKGDNFCVILDYEVIKQ